METALQSSTYFFSYSRADGDFVLKLAKDLRAASVPLWLDQLDIVGGDRWDQSIEKALHASHGMIVVLSPESIGSMNVMDEVSYALEENKRVIPVILRPCDVPFRLRRVQRIDFTAGDYATGLSQLLRALASPSASPPQEASPKAAETAPPPSAAPNRGSPDDGVQITIPQVTIPQVKIRMWPLTSRKTAFTAAVVTAICTVVAGGSWWYLSQSTHTGSHAAKQPITPVSAPARSTPSTEDPLPRTATSGEATPAPASSAADEQSKAASPPRAP